MAMRVHTHRTFGGSLQKKASMSAGAGSNYLWPEEGSDRLPAEQAPAYWYASDVQSVWIYSLEMKVCVVMVLAGDAQPATLTRVFATTVSFPNLDFLCKSGFS